MTNSPNIEIERYLTKQMTVSEAKDFEHLLDTNIELKESYKASLAVNELITEAGRLELKSTLDSFDSQITSSEGGRIIPLWVKRALPIAALLVVFLGVYQFGVFNTSLNASEVYDLNFETYASPSVVRDSNENMQSNWEVGAQLYRDKQFELAIEKFTSTQSDVPKYLISFYVGVSALSMTQPDYQMAITHFDQVLNMDNDYREQAKWYKGLVLLKIDRKAEALEIFKSIAESESYNSEKASGILKTKFKD